MNKQYLDWDDARWLVKCLYEQVVKLPEPPSLIIGISRGGLVPAVMLSHRLSIPMYPVQLSLRDHLTVLSNEQQRDLQVMCLDNQVLVVDDINDTGATLRCIQLIIPAVSTGVLIERMSTTHVATITGSKVDSDCWFVFPWETA